MLAYYGPEWESLASRIVGRWCPSFSGATGLQLPDTMGRNHGTLTNFPNNANGAYVTSPDKLALNLDGLDDYVALGPGLAQSGNFSVMGWANVRSYGINPQLFSRALFGNPFPQNWLLMIRTDEGTAEWAFQTTNGAGARYQIKGGGLVQTNVWSHVCVSHSMSGASLYINGIPITVTTIGTPNAEPVAGQVVNIGAYANVTNFFNGLIDDIMILNSITTGNEARFIFEQGRGGGLLMQPPRRRSVAAVIAALVLACETGNYSLTGQAAGLFASRLLAADQAQYILSGNAANTTASRLLSVDPASYTATGNDAATICARLLDGGAAAYALTGTDAGLIANRKLTADQAVYFLAGNNAELLRSLKLNAGSMALQLDNFAASLLADRKISADGAQYILVVSDANLTGSASGVAPYYYLFMMRGPQ